MTRGVRAWVVAWAVVGLGGCAATERRRVPVVVYGNARVQTGTGPDGVPVYETRRRAVGYRHEVVETRAPGMAAYLGASLGYRPVPDVASMEPTVAIGMHFDRTSVDHLVALRFGLGYYPGSSSCSELGGGARVTYAARFRYRPWYVGPEVGLGGIRAVRSTCRESSSTYEYESRSTIEIGTAGVVAGYSAGRWSAGASLRLGLGVGNADSLGFPDVSDRSDFLDLTVAFALETGYGF